MNLKRIGIYAGAFDPVHAGHIAFALQACSDVALDRIYFLPERRPVRRQGVEHFGHRVAMLKRAVKPHSQLSVLESVDISFSVARTLPRLQKQFHDCQLVMLMGAETAETIPDWPFAERLLSSTELVIAVDNTVQGDRVTERLGAVNQPPKQLYLLESYAPDVSSGSVRQALRERRSVGGLLASVSHYANRHWLYISLR